MKNYSDICVIVVTRFAVRWDGSLPDHEWIEKRFEILESYAFPSMGAQSVSGFEWVVLVDADVYETCQALFSSIADPKFQFRVIPLEHSSHDKLGWAGVGSPAAGSLNEIYPGADRFLTFRLDSDDLWHRKAIKDALIAASTVENAELLVNFQRGYCLELESGKFYPQSFKTFQGPFLAVRNGGRENMLDCGGNHTKARAGRIVVTQTLPRWIQLIHGGNLANRIDEDTPLTGNVVNPTDYGLKQR